MAHTLAHFPSICLETIFSHVPLDDLFRSIGLVCQSWYMSRNTVQKRLVRLVLVGWKHQLQDDELKENWFFASYGTDLIQHVRRDDGSPWLTWKSLDQIKFDSLVVRANKLTILNNSPLKNLSKITQLTLMYYNTPNATITQMILLIKHFSEHLVDLKLSFSFTKENNSGTEEIAHNITNLFGCLNRLQSLQKLKLYIRGLELRHLELHFRPKLEFLSRLTTFSIYVNGIKDWVDWILSSLSQFGRNIESIELHKDIRLQDMLQVDSQLDDKFKVLYLDDPEDYYDMKRFCTRFRLLTTLVIIECSLPMTMLARCLSQLSQLVNLHLDLEITGILVQDEEARLDTEEQPEVVSVWSVRLLYLNITTVSHRVSDIFTPEIFPNLQVLSLGHEIRECTDCEISESRDIHHHIENSEPELTRQLIECKRLFRQPFRHFPKLHTIANVDSYREETLISVNEL